MSEHKGPDSVNSQQEKEELTKLVREIVNCLNVKTEEDLKSCEKMAQELSWNIPKFEAAIKCIIRHKDIARQPSVIAFLNDLMNEGPQWSYKWRQPFEEAVAAYIQPLFKREGSMGYSKAVKNLDYFVFSWKGRLRRLSSQGLNFDDMWKELHRLSGSKTPFCSGKYSTIHDMAKSVKIEAEVDDFAWASHLDNLEDIVQQIMSQMSM